MTAVLFGSMSTLADTSEIQRDAFNDAFRQHGLDWSWSREEYQPLLRSSGGEQRVADYAAQRGEEVDAAAVHATKSELAQRKIAEGVQARPGVVETIRAAKTAGDRVALVTTTARANLDALFAGLADVSADDFDVITDASSVESSKPDPAAYALALDDLGADAGDAVAIEDNMIGLQAAVAAGVRAIAFPNENTAGHDFAGADEQVEQLDPDTVLTHR